MTNNLTKIVLLAGAVGLATIVGSNYLGEQNETLVKNTNRRNLIMRSNVLESVPNGPIYDSNILPSSLCSRYVRLAANELFDIDYPAGDAWELRDLENVDELKVKSYDDLKILSKNGTLRPGMLVGFYNPKSNYNSHPEAKKSGYTHVGLFLGEEKDSLYFAHQFGKETRIKESDSSFERAGLVPKEILFIEKK